MHQQAGTHYIRKLICQQADLTQIAAICSISLLGFPRVRSNIYDIICSISWVLELYARSHLLDFQGGDQAYSSKTQEIKHLRYYMLDLWLKISRCHCKHIMTICARREPRDPRDQTFTKLYARSLAPTVFSGLREARGARDQTFTKLYARSLAPTVFSGLPCFLGMPEKTVGA